MNILVTGGAGFIGSHLVEALLAKGYTVTILDNLSTGSEKNLKNIINRIKIVRGDIRNAELVDSIMKEVDLVFHMAAAVGVKNILHNTVESISTNLIGSQIILSTAAKLNKRIIIASTSEIYGKSFSQPINENSDRIIGTPQRIRWTYSDAKALEEAIATTLHRTQNLKVTILRFFNTVGPRQSSRYGMVVPKFIESALNNDPITIFGSGMQSRVFCHIYDAISATILCALNDNSIGKVFNVGGTEEITINNLALKIKTRLKSKSELIHIPYDEAYDFGYEDIQRRVPNISRIESYLGWKPTKSLVDVIDDIATTLR